MRMRRTSILLDPGLLAELERIARRQGRPTAHVIREALDEYVAAQAADRALPGFVGIAHGPVEIAPETETAPQADVPPQTDIPPQTDEVDVTATDHPT